MKVQSSLSGRCISQRYWLCGPSRAPPAEPKKSGKSGIPAQRRRKSAAQSDSKHARATVEGTNSESPGRNPVSLAIFQPARSQLSLQVGFTVSSTPLGGGEPKIVTARTSAGGGKKGCFREKGGGVVQTLDK